MHLHYSHKKNFGDALNPMLWNWIFPNLAEVKPEWDFYGVGTLLKADSRSSLPCRKLIMGSGYGYGRPVKLSDLWSIGFVRGPLTCQKLGLDLSHSMGDPAVLLLRHEMFSGRKRNSSGKSLLIPHHRSEEIADWEKLALKLNCDFCSPTSSLKTIVESILKAEIVYTESLHGAIFADGLGIPWVPIFSAKHLNFFKWRDWCMSMNIPFKPFMFPKPFRSAPMRSSDTIKGFMQRILSFLNINREKYSLSPVRPLALDEFDIYAENINQLLKKENPTLSSKTQREEQSYKQIKACTSIANKWRITFNSSLQ